MEDFNLEEKQYEYLEIAKLKYLAAENARKREESIKALNELKQQASTLGYSIDSNTGELIKLKL